MGPEGFLPPNIRLVSNFFCTGPDGMVNSFTFPVVHELNRCVLSLKFICFLQLWFSKMLRSTHSQLLSIAEINLRGHLLFLTYLSCPSHVTCERNMTTARNFRSGIMNQRLPPPPNALVLGASPSDLDLALGETERQVISIGYIENDANFLSNLPIFLSRYDIVILGDGGLQYVNHILEQILQINKQWSWRSTLQKKQDTSKRCFFACVLCVLCFVLCFVLFCFCCF